MRRPVKGPKLVDQGDPLVGDEQDVPELPDLPPRGAQSTKFAFRLVDPLLFEGVKDNKTTSPKSDFQDVSNLKAQFNALAPDLTAAGWQAAIDAAENDAVVSRMRKSEDRPGLYEQRPPTEHLINFLRREYRDKGWINIGYNGKRISRMIIAAYDPDCASAIEAFEKRRDLLPDDVRPVKVRNKKNVTERKNSANAASVR